MDETFEFSADLYRYWQVDYQRNKIRIQFQDGRTVEEELSSAYGSEETHVASSVFNWESWWIFSTTCRGHVIITEGFNPNSPPPLQGRPAVYLDQNHWRTMADVLHDPMRISDREEREAAQDLIHLAVDGGVVLPLSMGHMLETASLHSERRYEVGLTMASLAGGWQMRNPLDLWKREAELTIRNHLGLSEVEPAHSIVTEPGALFGSDTSLGIAKGATNFEKFMAMLTMPNVVLSSLIEPESTPKHPLAKWINHHARITSQIASVDLPKDQRRKLARRRYWNENIAFYTVPYRRLTRSPDFPTFSDRELVDLFSDSPLVGLLSELFTRRFMDRQSKWRRNDLIDMFHLSSAAAYADYVCAETHTGTQLRDAQRILGRDETVFTSLCNLVAAVRRGGVMSESERLSSTETDASNRSGSSA